MTLCINKVKNVFDEDILGFSISSFVAAAPLGYIMHQIDISLNSPFNLDIGEFSNYV